MSVPKEGASAYVHRLYTRAIGAACLVICLQFFGCASSPTAVDAAVDTNNPVIRNVPGGGTFTPAAPTNSSSKRVRLGASVQGTPIDMEVFGIGPDHILFVGGVHGDEPNGALLAERLLDLLRDHPELAAGRTIGVVARANPDGLKANTRVNAHGVDLNRNFPTRDWRKSRYNEFSHGEAPCSEPETKAIVAAVERLRPRRLIDIHSIAGGEQCNNFDGPAEKLAALMCSHNGYPVSTDIGYPTPGALGCWAGIDLRIPAITLELPRGEASTTCWRDNAEALRAAIRGVQEATVARDSNGTERREPAATGRK